MDHFVTTPDGLLLILNGIDPVLRWDGAAPQAEPAGVKPPLTAPTIAGSGSGNLTGEYTAYLRFVDQYGNVSDLSPVGSVLTVSGVFQINYTNVAVPVEGKVVRRQLLRSTASQATTYYVDIDTTDLSSTSFSSTKEDDVLATDGEAVPIFTSLGELYANANGVPPAHKAVAVHHIARMLYAVDGVYSEGGVKVTQGSLTVTGVATEWPETMEGRFLWVNGAMEYYEIASVDVANQTLTLETPYTAATDPFATYSIRPPSAERRLVYFSEAGFPEAVPVVNAISIQDNGDEITGMMPMGSFVYILERRHMHRWSYQTDPARDGAIFKGEDRGCINQKCWVIAEDNAYMLDDAGIHSFNGQSSDPISNAVSEWFRTPEPDEIGFRINWAGSHYFFAVHFPTQEVVRWFVTLAADYLPKHCIAYNYRHNRWWIEEFESPIGSACLGSLNSRGQVFLGSEARRILAYWIGSLDGAVVGAGTVRGTVTSATAMSLTDSAATFATAGVVGSPIVIAAGAGKGQSRLIIGVSGTTITVNQPWTEQPDTTSTYQIGGIGWKWASGRFHWTPSEPSTTRTVKAKFQPLADPATMDMRVYDDFSTDPVVWQRDQEETDGVTSVAGDPDIVCNLTKANGRVQARMDSGDEGNAEASDLMALELEGVTNTEQVKIRQIVVEGADQ